MKQLTIPDIEYDSLGLEAFWNSKEDKDDSTFKASKAYDKIAKYNKSPNDFKVSDKAIKSGLFLSIDGKSPTSATELLVRLEKTLKEVYTVVGKLESDRYRQARILEPVIHTFYLNLHNYTGDEKKPPKHLYSNLIDHMVEAAHNASDTYYNYIGRSIQAESEKWVGGSPFNLKRVEDSFNSWRYRNSGGGKLKSVSAIPKIDKTALDRLVKVFIKHANPKTGTFDNSSLNDKSFKRYVEYSLDPDYKGMGSAGELGRQAMSIIFSGKSNSQTLQLELCESMRKVYTSLLIYLSAVIAEK